MDTTRRRPDLPLIAAIGVLLAAITLAAIASTFDLAHGRPGAATDDPGGAAPRTDTATRPSAGPAAPGFALWGRTEDGDALRWDACSPIHFVLNTEGAPEGASDDLRSALELLADASGLRLILDGRTDERPGAERPLVERDGTAWRWRPVLVAWADPGEGDLPLTPLDRAVALPVAVRDGDREAFVTGQVVVNARRGDLRVGFGDRTDSLGALLLHEIAHILGLDHVEEPGEMMWVRPGSGAVALGPGDRAGLRAIGAEAGCRSAPDPTVGRGLEVRG